MQYGVYVPYSKLVSVVKWNGVLSKLYSRSCGVRQGAFFRLFRRTSLPVVIICSSLYIPPLKLYIYRPTYTYRHAHNNVGQHFAERLAVSLTYKTL